MLRVVLEVVVQMHGGKQNILPIVEIKPRLVVLGSDGGCGERAHIGAHSKLLGSDQRFYNFLCSVAMVHVEINDGNSFDLVPVLGL